MGEVRRVCEHCRACTPALRRPRTGEAICRECFFTAIENEVHETIVANKLFNPGERVALGASGGKDSTVLAHVVSLLNQRHGYGLDLLLLSIDEGISGYRDDSLETVKRNEAFYGIPLKILSYKELYGWTMDEIVARIGRKNNCTFCGVFRRQALDRGAEMLGAHKIATGHNADDIAETVLLNLLRGDVARLGRCTSAVTGGGDDEGAGLPRVKPFKNTYEKEIVMYAYYKKLDYFATECKYAPFASRGFAREFVKDLEAIRPRAIADLIQSGEAMSVAPEAIRTQAPRRCTRCGFLSSQEVCKACLMLQGLETGDTRLGIGRVRGQRGKGGGGDKSGGCVGGDRGLCASGRKDGEGGEGGEEEGAVARKLEGGGGCGGCRRLSEAHGEEGTASGGADHGADLRKLLEGLRTS